jgi:hypothetical protein
MAGIADLISGSGFGGLASGGGGISPLALLAAAQGLLSPGASGGARMANGIGGFMQGMESSQKQQMNAMQMKKAMDDLAREQTQQAAIDRLTGDGSAYQPQSFEGMGADVNGMGGIDPFTVEANDPMADMMAANPQGFLKAKMDATFNPMGKLPDSIQEMLYYAKNPELADMKAKLDPTGPMARLQAAGIKPGTPEALDFLKNSGRTSINVQTGENLQERGLADLNKGQLEGMQAQFNSAVDALPQLARMRQNIAAGLQTGQLANVKKPIAGLFADLGVDQSTVDKFFNLTEGDDFNSAQKQLTMAAIKAFGANPSNAEREFAAESVANMKNTPQSALRLIDRIYSKNASSVKEYGSALDALPANSPNASMLRSTYKTRMETYNKYLNRLNPPTGAPPGTSFAYEDYDGNAVYQTPDGKYMRFRPDGAR